MAKLNWFSENALYYYGIIFNSEDGEIDLEQVKESFDDDFDDAAECIVDLVNEQDNDLDTLTPLWWDEWEDYVYAIDDLDDKEQTDQCQGEGATVDWSLEADDGKTLSEGTYICQYDRLVNNPKPKPSYLSKQTFTENHYLLGYGSRIHHRCDVYDVPDDIDIDQIKLIEGSYFGLKFDKSKKYRAVFGHETVGCDLYYKGEVFDPEDGDDYGADCVCLFLCKYNTEIKQWEVIDYLRYGDEEYEDEEYDDEEYEDEEYDEDDDN